MAKVKVTTKFKITELVDGFMDNTTSNILGKTIVEEALDNIAQGISPVRGYGRFERYKDRKKYPGDRKPARPVNLWLSGAMLRAYWYRLGRQKNSIEVGIVRGSLSEKNKASYHNEGTEHMAQRKITPGEGEEWSVTIMRAIRDVYSNRLANLIRQSNK